jgi:ubiquinone/menaquinone biosynthesis C-methylase UbiE
MSLDLSRLPSAGGASLWHRIGRQLANPRGIAGRLIGRLMIPLNRLPNRLAIAQLAPQAGETILEVGFGPGDGLAGIIRAAPDCRLSGLDRSAEMIDLARRRNSRALAGRQIDLCIGNVLCLPWPDRSFDKILAVNVAYFFDEDGRATGELLRVLRPGGRLVVYVTDRRTMARWRFAGPQTHRTYDEPGLRTMLEDAGFPADAIRTTPVSLPFGLRGWIAVAERR